MTLARYFLKRFFLSVISISSLIALLFSLVEFFEKMVRVKGVVFATVAKFTLLNAVPTFFESLPLGTWLATCLFIKELDQQGEWEALSIVTISPKKIQNLFLLGGVILSLFSFVGKEILFHGMHNQAESFRKEQFKNHSQKTLFDSWSQLSEKSFSHFDFLDLEKKEGTNLTILFIKENGTIKKTLKSHRFTIDTEKERILCNKSSLFTVATGEEKIETNKILPLPSFFKQLTIATKNPSVAQLSVYLATGTIPSPQIKRNIMNELFKRIFPHSLLLFYPILTFLFFLLFPYHPLYKWFLILVPYPLLTTLSIVFEGLAKSSLISLLILSPYLIALLSVIFLQRKVAS
jgi:lipopolysaccharide export LptBFGC system permease protein LptF